VLYDYEVRLHYYSDRLRRQFTVVPGTMKEVPRRPMPFLLICFGLLAISAIFVLVMSKEEEVVVSPGGEQQEETNAAICFVPKISIAFCGNSMLYFNDCPRLMEQMCHAFEFVQSRQWYAKEVCHASGDDSIEKSIAP
jgi:hypothetical protein